METKICIKCGQELPITDFHWRNKSKNQRRGECKFCHNAYMNQKNANNRQYIQQLKMKYSCKKCGETRWYLLDFHHIDPNEKENTVAKLMVHSSLTKTLEEIEKCIPLCANCHREFHYLEKENNITLDEYLSSE